MALETSGKIYLADQRGLLETNYLRRYSTFSFGEYAHPDKQAFGRLYGFNEETLAGAHTLELAVSQASHVLLLPITGALAVGINSAPAATIEVGEVRVVTVPAGTTLCLANPYQTELVSCLHIWLLAEVPTAHIAQQVFPFDLQATENQLAEAVSFGASQHGAFSLSLGQFAGRREAVYHLQRPGTQFFAFVLAGAFEMEGRLLHAQDGLALWNVAAVELEALSNNALVIVLELA